MIKFGNIDNYVTDDSLEAGGVELDFGKGIFLTIKRAGGSNAGFQSRMADILATRNTDVIGKATNEEDEKQLLYSLFANHVVIGWRGLKDENGNEIEFSPQNCIDLFNSSDEIYKHVSVQSITLDNFRKQQVTESGNE